MEKIDKEIVLKEVAKIYSGEYDTYTKGVLEKLANIIESLQGESICEDIKDLAYKSAEDEAAADDEDLSDISSLYSFDALMRQFIAGAKSQKEIIIKWLALEKNFLINQCSEGKGDLAKRYRAELYGEIITKLNDM